MIVLIFFKIVYVLFRVRVITYNLLLTHTSVSIASKEDLLALPLNKTFHIQSHSHNPEYEYYS